MAKAEPRKMAQSAVTGKWVSTKETRNPNSASEEFPPHLVKIGVRNAADAKKFLQDAGIITPSGKLSPNYGGK